MRPYYPFHLYNPSYTDSFYFINIKNIKNILEAFHLMTFYIFRFMQNHEIIANVNELKS